VLSGDVEALRKVSFITTGWYEMLPAVALYLHPHAAVTELREIAEETIALCRGEEEDTETMGTFDEALLALCSLNVLRALQVISGGSSDWWLCAHLADLCHKVDQRIIHSAYDLRSFLILDYASTLIQIPGLGLLSVEYFVECGDRGIEQLQQHLMRMKMGSERELMKWLDVCRRLSLKDLASSLCRQRALSLQQQDAPMAALAWTLRVADSAFTTAIVEQILEREPIELSVMHMLTGLGETILECPSLLFLHKYHLVHNRMSEGQWKEAGRLLFQLITSRIAPRTFWPVLYREMLTVLAQPSEQRAIDREETYEMLRFLQESTMEMKLTGGGEPDDQLLLTSIRLSLLDNLAMVVTGQ